MLNRVVNIFKNKIIWIYIIIGLTSFFSFYAVKANMDLAEGRYGLFAEEIITFDAIKKVLVKTTFSEQFNEIVKTNGNRLYGYGQILENASYVVSYFPYKWWGDKGAIIATRVFQTFCLWLAYFVLTFTFVRSWPLRAILLCSLFCIPTTVYYSHIPKPESIQLLFLAFFLNRGHHYRYRFGFYWILLGVSFGAKISFLLLVPFFIGVALYQHKKQLCSGLFFKKSFFAMIGFLSGFSLSETSPILSVLSRSLNPLKDYYDVAFVKIGTKATNSIENMIRWIEFFFSKYRHVPYLAEEYPAVPKSILMGTIFILFLLVSIAFLNQKESKRAKESFLFFFCRCYFNLTCCFIDKKALFVLFAYWFLSFSSRHFYTA
ncbi:hypothetical protein ACFL49_00685 [Candidatus Omnitrophota bacterium]